MSFDIISFNTRPREGNGGALLDVPGEERGDGESVTDGNSYTCAEEGLHEITATSDCRIRIGSDADDGTGGVTWHSGKVAYRYLRPGDKVGVSAL